MTYSALAPRSGILFHSHYLQSHSFLIFLSFVAINTLIYLGITLLKLFPRPKPQLLLHPKVLHLLAPKAMKRSREEEPS
jgi:hypothetical protein